MSGGWLLNSGSYREEAQAPDNSRKISQCYGLNHPDIVQEAVRHFAIIRREPTKGVDELSQTTLEKLGVRVLWVDSHAQTLPELSQMYEFGSARWDDVYGCAAEPSSSPDNVVAK